MLPKEYKLSSCILCLFANNDERETTPAVGVCGGGTPTAVTGEPVPSAACNPADPATAAECGTLILGLTDTDGDLLNYRVDVVSLAIE